MVQTKINKILYDQTWAKVVYISTAKKGLTSRCDLCGVKDSKIYSMVAHMQQ